MRIAVLGPGGVGGLVAGALAHAGVQVTVVAREETAATIERDGLEVTSVTLGHFHTQTHAVSHLREDVDALIVATKASGLAEATDRVEVAPTLVVPLLNGLDHMGFLTERFQGDTVAAGAIRVESDRRSPGVIVHSSPFLRVDMAGPGRVAAAIERLAATLERSGVPARVCGSEAEVLWGKLVRLNALACTTSAFDKLLGEILSTPELRSELVGAIDEGCAVAAQERAPIEPGKPLAELAAAHATLGSSMQRDIAAGRLPEIDAIPGSVLRAADRHGIDCPTIERMVELILRRAGLPASAVSR